MESISTNPNLRQFSRSFFTLASGNVKQEELFQALLLHFALNERMLGIENIFGNGDS